MALRDVLKAKGFTDADLETLTPLLSDPRLEDYVGGLETRASEAESLNGSWDKKFTDEFGPAMRKMEDRLITESRRAADYEAQLKLAKDWNLLPADPAPASPAPPNGNPLPPDPSKFLTRADFDAAVNQFSDAHGFALAMSANLALEYQQLMGQSVLSYTTETSDGRTLRGMEAFRQETMQASKRAGRNIGMNEFVAQKFDFAGKRAALEAKGRQEHEDAVGRDAVAKFIREHPESANPFTRPPVTSLSPFLERASGDKKLPWEAAVSENQGTQDRLSFVRTKVAEDMAKRVQ
jgi:hypothetical protein